MSATPRLDAVAAWVAAGRSGPIAWPPELEHMSVSERYRAILRAASSGAPALLPSPPPAPAARTIPPPPRRRKRLNRRTP